VLVRRLGVTDPPSGGSPSAPDDARSFYEAIARPSFESARARKHSEAAEHGATALLLEQVRQAFPSGTIPAVLEVGGEYAATLAVVRETFRVGRATSCDLVVPAQRTEGIEYLALPAESLSQGLGLGSFDLVMLNDVIEHVYDTDRVIEEVRAVTRPGGYITVITPNLSSWLNRLLLASGFLPLDMEVSTRAIFGHPSAPGTHPVGHIRVFTIRALEEFLRFHGFRIVAARTAPLGFSDSTFSPTAGPSADPAGDGRTPPALEPGRRARLLRAIVRVDSLIARLAPSLGSRIVLLARLDGPAPANSGGSPAGPR